MSRRRKQNNRRRGGSTPRPWQPLYECDTVVYADGQREAVPPGFKLWRNDRYVVIHHVIEHEMGAPDMHHLSLRRVDRKPVTDWRDKQRIKTQLLGPEAEAIELYPAESRVVDTSNQYHLWSIEGVRWPVGFDEGRHVGDAASAAAVGAVQREPDEVAAP